jgi:hypothetical protein
VALDTAGPGTGVPRYKRSRENPSPQLTIAVEDWQRRGVGARLAGALADRARDNGVTIFTGLVLAETELNAQPGPDLGEVRILDCEHGTVELPERGPGCPTRLLHAIGAEELKPLPARREAGVPARHPRG